MIRRMLRILFAACVLALAVNAATAATPSAVTPDGGRYYGPLVNGKLKGNGRLEWGNGDVYEGDFANGLMWGRGELRYHNGRAYRGELVRGEWHGKGRLETTQGGVPSDT